LPIASSLKGLFALYCTMLIYLQDQTSNLPGLLQRFRTVAVNPYDPTLLKEQISTIEIDTNKRLAELNLSPLFANQIFPASILTSKADWEIENRAMRVGDTVVQQVYLPPGSKMSQKIIFGVRIKEIINEENRKGFSYEALKGHVEKGISIFTVEQLFEGIVFRIHTYSKPGNLVSALMGPIFSDKYQQSATQAALKNMKRQLEEMN
jgi:hypothetical protein